LECGSALLCRFGFSCFSFVFPVGCGSALLCCFGFSHCTGKTKEKQEKPMRQSKATAALQKGRKSSLDGQNPCQKCGLTLYTYAFCLLIAAAAIK
jgi:hypothetical protein